MGVPLATCLSWRFWYVGPKPQSGSFRPLALVAGLIAISTNAAIYYAWLAYRVYTSGSSYAWELKRAAGNVGVLLAFLGILGAILGSGKGRVMVAIAAFLGFMLWIAVGVL